MLISIFWSNQFATPFYDICSPWFSMEHKFVWPKRLTLNWKKLICWSYDNMCHKVTTYSRLKTIENLLKERFCYYSLDVSTKFLLTCMQVACFIYLPLDGKLFFVILLSSWILFWFLAVFFQIWRKYLTQCDNGQKTSNNCHQLKRAHSSSRTQNDIS